MARPTKQGINYFPYDTELDQDDKLGMIIGEFDHKGEYAYTKLLCWIYKNEGYYTEWKEDVQLRFMRRYNYCGFSLSFIVKELVPRCIKWGLFDKTVFDAFQILTSSRIQETWLQATRQRTGRIYIPNYWLIEVSHVLQAGETKLIPEVIDKVKESKENEIKENDVLAHAVPPPAIISDPVKAETKKTSTKKFIPPSVEEAKDFFKKIIGNPKKPGHWPADKCENEACKYHNHYTANGWKQGRGKPIVDWEAAARNWITNEREGTFSPPVYTSQPKQTTPAAEQKPVLSKLEMEVNYLYESFCEDQTKVTIISVDPLHYNLLKNSGMINFSDEKVEEIKSQVTTYLTDQKIIINEQSMLKHMKRFGVLECFKDKSKQGLETIFKI